MMMAISSTTAQDEKLSAFLKDFPTPLNYRQPDEYSVQPWVFWSTDAEEEGSQITNSSSSSLADADLQPPPVPYHNIIKSAFSKLDFLPLWEFMVQLWAPVTINGINLLSTSRQPFALKDLDKDNLKKYRLRSVEYHFNIDDDVNNQQLHIQQDEDEDEGNYPIILSGGPAAAFLNCMPDVVHLKDHKQRSPCPFPLACYALECGFGISYMLPICFPSQTTSSCIGVVEITTPDSHYDFGHVEITKMALKGVKM